MGETIVGIADLCKRFKDLDALAGLSLEVNGGELFSIVGPDGAGKTTLVKILCGVTPPTSGKVRMFGFSLDREFSKIKRRIGYLSQGFSLYGDLTVDENIEFFAEIHDVRDYRERRERLLELTKLMPFRARLAENLSGGMKKKLALACTLVHRPLLIFLDEPTTGVDPVSRRDFWAILALLLKEGITIVMTTPYMDEAERSTRVALLNKGRLLAAGGPGDIRSLMTGTVFEVVCADAWKAFTALKRCAEPIEVQISGDRLHLIVEGGGADFDAVRVLLEREGIEIDHWGLVEPSLENVFIRLLGRERRGR